MPTKQADSQPPRGGVRDRILQSAVAILREAGIQALTQSEVARRAGVRQSHLTYYFPTRDDLLEAVTQYAVAQLATGLGTFVASETEASRGSPVERLAAGIADRAHMRMFVAMIVEADRDPAVRAIVTRGTQRLEAAVAETLGDGRNRARARMVLAALWGLGLYRFLMRPGTQADPTRTYLSWLAAASSERALRSRASRHHTR